MRRTSSTARRLAAVAAAAALTLTACGGSSLDDVEVSGGFGDNPEMEVPDDYSTDESTVEVLSEGDGDEVADGDDVAVNFEGVAGSTGTTFYNTFQQGQPLTLTVGNDEQGIPGLSDQLIGQTLGSRLLIAIAPEDAYGADGNPQLGIEPDETLVMTLDLLENDAPEATGTVDDVTVTGGEGEAAPTVEFPEPLYVDETQTAVVREGTGAVVKEGGSVTADYLGVNGRTGETFDSSFRAQGQPQTFSVDPDGELIPGLVEGLTGQRLGSRVVIAIPSPDAFGAAGNSQSGIEPGDTIIFVMDLQAPPKPNGDISDVTVTGEPLAEPQVDFEAPLVVAETESRVLSEGEGPVVAEGDAVDALYTGINGRTGEPFDGNYGGAPVPFTFDQGALIDGFLQGLVGKRVGSRVLITIPSKDGYGQGNPDAGIEAGDTLVFVVDLLTPEQADQLAQQGQQDEGQQDEGQQDGG